MFTGKQPNPAVSGAAAAAPADVNPAAAGAQPHASHTRWPHALALVCVDDVCDILCLVFVVLGLQTIRGRRRPAHACTHPLVSGFLALALGGSVVTNNL